ncbi:hypothetical protein ASE01_20010 [Nocardioides sp. Root190]|uniref:hypothetical protein n=1 Tax=Nocardioides sp. Root190 TaxID=1736488 RepID=UPI0006F38424|nr:hypothetical protein [Nocardioides sp. Root190]KRB73063.1 hypothetical protein ASE01_20010 [Nocardioides sp. Root190]
MTTPSPAEFLAASYPDDEHEEPITLDDLVHDLERRVTALESSTPTCDDPVCSPEQSNEIEATGLRTREDWLDEHLADLEEKHRVVLELVGEIGGIVKKSTSKVSLEVKAAIDAWADPQTPSPAPGDDAPEPAVDEAAAVEIQPQDVQQRAGEGSQTMGGFDGQPTHDADVEAWRAYAGGQGWSDVDHYNRSQIRTLLGIEQPAGA